MEPKDYKVTKINGDYAYLRNLLNGEDILVERDLLPEGADEETLLHWDNSKYIILE